MVIDLLNKTDRLFDMQLIQSVLEGAPEVREWWHYRRKNGRERDDLARPSGRLL